MLLIGFSTHKLCLIINTSLSRNLQFLMCAWKQNLFPSSPASESPETLALVPLPKLVFTQSCSATYRRAELPFSLLISWFHWACANGLSAMNTLLLMEYFELLILGLPSLHSLRYKPSQGQLFVFQVYFRSASVQVRKRVPRQVAYS